MSYSDDIEMDTLVRTAWQARFEQDFVFALQCLEKFEHQYMLNVSAFDIQNQPFVFRRNIAHSILLRAWVARREQNLPKAYRLYEAIKDFMSKSELEYDFFFLFEGSCQALQKLDLSLALDLCLRAVGHAQDDWCRISAQVNLLGVCESLGMRNKETEDQLTNFFSKEKNRSLVPLAYYGFAEFKQRILFRSGEFSSLVASITEFDQQRGYVGYASWVCSLPFVATGAPKFNRQSGIDNFTLNDKIATFKVFKQNTINFIVDERDFINPYLPLLCDRFYLWVWNWLVDPHRVPCSMWMMVLRNLDLPRQSRSMSSEDRVLVANALHWLALVSPKVSAIVDSLVSQLGVLNRQLFPLYEFEYLLIQHLKDRWVGQKFLRPLENHSLFGSNQLLLADLLKSTLDPSHPLFDLHRFLVSKSAVQERDQIFISMGSSIIEYQGISCKSKPLSRAFFLVANEFGSPIGLDEFYQFTFEQKKYLGDQEDYRRIFNLLNRFKSYTQVVKKVSLSHGVLHFEIDTQRLVVLPMDARERFVEELNWTSDGDSISANAKEKVDLGSELIEFILARHEISRLDFERAFSVSRATASRQLQLLKNQKKIFQMGKGKQARYRASLD